MQKNKTYCINAFKGVKMLPNNSIDVVVTSPPYWGLRDYGHDDQIGSEDDPEEYVENMVALFENMKPKLKKTGTMFINIGDTYSSVSGGMKDGNHGPKSAIKDKTYVQPKTSYRNKTQLLIPYRFAIKMIDRGWILRNIIIWRKPNAMPSAVKDRYCVDFEPIFFFSKEEKYFFNEPLEPADGYDGRAALVYKGTKYFEKRKNERMKWRFDKSGAVRLQRTVWDIPTKPIKYAHFAPYPEELVQKILFSACPEKGLVLDPFMGSGTTGIVATKMGFDYIGFELNDEYIEIENKRRYDHFGMFEINY